MELKTIEREGKPARHYIDGKPCHSDDLEYVKVKARIQGKQHCAFQTVRKNGATYHYSYIGS